MKAFVKRKLPYAPPPTKEWHRDIYQEKFLDRRERARKNNMNRPDLSKYRNEKTD